MSWETNYLNFKSNSSLDSLAAYQARQSLFNHFLQNGLPTKKDEAWKYTSLNDFKSIDWKSKNSFDLSHDQLLQISKSLPAEFYNLVFVNGVLNKTLSDDLTDEVSFVEIEADDLQISANHAERKLLSLSNAYLTKKIIIELPQNKTFEKPMHIVFVQCGDESNYLSESFNLKAHENSEATIILHTLSLNNSAKQAFNLNVKFELSNLSRVKLIQVQNEQNQNYHFSQTEVVMQSEVSFQALVLSLGSLLTRNYLNTNFVGHRSNAEVYGLTVLDSNQHVDNYTFIQHTLGENQSKQHYKSILAGSSQNVFRGRVLIEPDAQKANSEQLNNNLLLTKEASANSIPQLEIYADDVKAGHGSTVGQLNKEEIFYFLSRGISQFEAVKMLSFGYAQDLIMKFDNPDVQNFLMKILKAKLERMISNG